MNIAALTIPAIFTAIDRLTQPVRNMTNGMTAFQRSLRNTTQSMDDVAKKAALLSGILITPMYFAAKDAMNFEDAMADVAKTTGLSGLELNKFGKEILKYSRNTRSSIEDLQQIGVVGGQMGVAKNELLDFVKAADVFNVALGKDFEGGVEQAISSVSKIKKLFADTRNFTISESILKTGAAINELGAVGQGTTQNITDFVLRVGALPDKLKPSFTAVAALGTFMEESGIDSEISARAFSDFVLEVSKRLPAFAKQMQMSTAEATQFFNLDPVGFAQKFARGLNKMSNQKVAQTMSDLSLNSSGVLKTIGALGDETERLNYLMNISANAVRENTSLFAEYEKKNNTTLAGVQKLKNGIHEFSITMGDILIPKIDKAANRLQSFLNAVTDFAKEYPVFTSKIVMSVVWIGLLAGGISLVTFAISSFIKATFLSTAGIAAWNFVLGISNFLTGKNYAAVLTSSAAYYGLVAATYAQTAAQWLLNTSMYGFPILWIIAGVALLIAIIVKLVSHWDKVKEAFANNGFIGALKEIGKVLLDLIITPIDWIITAIAKITKADWAVNGMNAIDAFRANLGVETVDKTDTKAPLPALSTRVTEQNTLFERIEQSSQKEKIELSYNNMPSNVNVSATSGIAVRGTTTMMGGNV